MFYHVKAICLYAKEFSEKYGFFTHFSKAMIKLDLLEERSVVRHFRKGDC